MTASERSTLDLVISQLDRMEAKQDRIDDRLRVVEVATAGNVAADARTAQQAIFNSSSWTVRFGGVGVLLSLILALSNFISLHH